MTNHPKKSIFLHIPKTAGVSIFHTFKDIWLDIQGHIKDWHIDRKCKQGIFTGHAPLWQLVEWEVVDPEYLEDAVIFFVLRNSYERFLSLYYYLNFKYTNKHGKHWQPVSIMEYAASLKDAPKDRHNAGHPHTYWLRGLKNPIAIPFGPGMQKGLNRVCKLIGIDPRPLKYMNENPNYPNHLPADIYRANPGLQQLVAEVYGEEIERFKMTFPY
jgi:hypothetical protein